MAKLFKVIGGGVNECFGAKGTALKKAMETYPTMAREEKIQVVSWNLDKPNMENIATLFNDVQSGKNFEVVKEYSGLGKPKVE